MPVTVYTNQYLSVPYRCSLHFNFPLIMHIKILAVFLLISIVCYDVAQSEVFTALVDITKVFDTEKEIGQILQDFISEEQKRLQKLAEFSNKLRGLKSTKFEKNEDLEKYFSNPLNAYLFARNFAMEWQSKLNILSNFTERSHFLELKNKLDGYQQFLPSQEDIDGSADALLRLQETYHLKTEDLVEGRVQTLTSESKLTANDCFKIGVRAYNKGNYIYATKWLKVALSLFDVGRIDNLSELLRVDIMDYLAYCMGVIGKYREALLITSEMLKIPNLDIEEKLLGNKRWYLEKLANETAEPEFKEFESVQEDEVYTSLCRGESPINYTQNIRKLKCYLSRKTPYLKLRPLKVEIAFDKPRLFILHDIIYDQEIEHIKEVASPHLNRATVKNPVTGVLETANYRISKSAWLPTNYDSITRKINNRIIEVTGLSIDTAEDLQVVNYGVGGHYSPHFDHGRTRPDDDFDIQRGNRIATLLFYMSNVEAGGATVFVDVGAKLWPTKGSAAFWYNLKRSGDSDDLTRHAACPVLVGSKWVMNKWFREKGQEFRRPCSKKNI